MFINQIIIVGDEFYLKAGWRVDLYNDMNNVSNGSKYSNGLKIVNKKDILM